MTDVVQIKTGEAPSGQFPPSDQKKDEIRGLLHDTSPFYVDGTGLTYRCAASKIQHAVDALEEHASRIVEIWKGPDATYARHAIWMLRSSGKELSGAMMEMGGALSNYATELTDAQAKVDEPVVNVPDLGEGPETQQSLRKALEDSRARTVLGELNEKILAIYNSRIPDEVVFDLPKIGLPGGSGPMGSPNYPSGSGHTPLTFGTPAGDNGTGTGSGGSGGSGTGLTNPGSTPGGSDPSGSDPDGSTPGDSGLGDDPATLDPDSPSFDTPADPDPAQQQDTDSQPGDIAPPVIGGDGTTTTDGADAVDPRRTDLAFTPPPNTVTPTTFTPTTFTPTTPTPTVNPPGVLTPIGSSPGIPSVIGSPGVGGPGQVSMLAGGRGAPGMAGGMPMMPMMGGGAGGGGGHSDHERTTYLSEDPNSWTTARETTDPVIG